ncbi:hypothetical protein [Microseira sp. BLCC-F43]|jgi:hypothetical protein|uniref:hypothetical protein n=1 Tax=Microseira sp. BLCC-F43 TaxID=3153602 RepID=UPI0035BA1BFB
MTFDAVRDINRRFALLFFNKYKTIVEYARRDINKPIGISTYQLQAVLPEQLQGSLPTIEELELELNTAAWEIEVETDD